MLCEAHVSGVQLVVVPHLPAPPPPHVWPVGQLPHMISFPQPSPAGPQSIPWSAHVFAVHTGVYGCTHALKSNSMNSRMASCGVKWAPLVAHASGNVVPSLSTPHLGVPASLKDHAATHWLAGAAPMGDVERVK